MQEAKELQEPDPQIPNHIIIWLDASIGEPGKYIHLKQAFGSNTDPRAENWRMLGDRDYENLMREEAAATVTFEGVTFLLYCVDTITKCINAFEQHQEKRIFFITSGSLGREAVPLLIERFPQKFRDPSTNQTITNVFVFCHIIQWQLDWTAPFLDYILAFDFDKDLLARLIREISNYFYDISIRFRDDNQLHKALQHINWSKKLWDQYQKNLSNSTTDKPVPVPDDSHMLEIEKVIADIERNILETRERSRMTGNGGESDHANDSEEDCNHGAEPS